MTNLNPFKRKNPKPPCSLSFSSGSQLFPEALGRIDGQVFAWLRSVVFWGDRTAFSKGPFPARGFAKVLTKEEADLRLNRYRGFLTRI